jgi:hypothetical protein
MILVEVIAMFGLPTFFLFFGIGASIAILWLLIRYGIPLIFLMLQTIYLFFKTIIKAFAEGWNEAGDGKK